MQEIVEHEGNLLKVLFTEVSFKVLSIFSCADVMTIFLSYQQVFDTQSSTHTKEVIWPLLLGSGPPTNIVMFHPVCC
jgi:hypothetical protein